MLVVNGARPPAPGGYGADIAPVAALMADPARAAMLAALLGGSAVAEVRRSRRFAGACLDWTQRRRHLNGALGAAVTDRLLQLGWIERGPSGRAVRVTEAGQAGPAETFGWSAPD